MTDTTEDQSAITALSFWEHLAELRKRLLWCVISLVGGFIVAWIFKEQLFSIVSAPVKEGLAAHGIYRLTAIETVEAVVVYLKLSFSAAIVVSVPVALLQIWLFIKPGLIEREIRPMRRIAVLAMFMFVLGLVFSYQFVLPLVIDYLTGFTLGAGDIDFQVTMKSAYSTTLLFLVGFGIIFELPLVMVLLAATPLFNSARYLKWIRYSVVLSFVVGSMLTPPDVLSQMLMAIPVTILYCIGIGLTYVMENRREKEQAVVEGFDWILAGAVVFLTGVITLLVMPAPVPMAAYLPYGAGTVTLGRQTTKMPTCNRTDSVSLPPEAAINEWVCARYTEGNVLLLRSDSLDTADYCASLPDDSGERCVSIDDIHVIGQPMLVARYMSNMEDGRQDADPLKVDDTTVFSQFVSLLATPKQQRSYLRFTFTGGEEPELQLDLSFSDANEAEHFIHALDNNEQVQTSVAEDLSIPEVALAAAIEELCAAVEILAAKHNSTELKQVRKRLQRARELAGQAPAATVRTPFGSCTTAACAYAALAPLLPASFETDQRGRVITLLYSEGSEEHAEKVINFLLR